MDQPLPHPVAELFLRYLMTLDTGGPDAEQASDLFTPDIVVEFPMSRHEGIAGVDVYHTNALSRFAATQHLSSPPLVSPAGDAAVEFEAQVLSVHVHRTPAEGRSAEGGPADGRPARFSAGTHATGGARLTPAGWRLHRLAFRVVWVDGVQPR